MTPARTDFFTGFIPLTIFNFCFLRNVSQVSLFDSTVLFDVSCKEEKIENNVKKIGPSGINTMQIRFDTPRTKIHFV